MFSLLYIRFFEKLFKMPIFIYPVTALTFGFALYMIGSLTRLVGVVLEQLLNVLKWLAVIAGLILAVHGWPVWITSMCALRCSSLPCCR